MNTKEFGKIRAYLWPIHGNECKKFIPMFFMLFFICFNYTVLRNLKDTLVITAENSGAAVIPFIKVWVMLPAAIISTILFTWASNRFSRKHVFYIVIGTFLFFLGLFAFVIFPAREALALDGLSHYLQPILPTGMKGFLSMIRNWPLTLFYVISELWSTLVFTVLFWGFANEITKLSEASRFYGMLNVGSNIATIIAGQVAATITTQAIGLQAEESAKAWQHSIEYMTFLMLISGGCALYILHWMSRHVLQTEVVPIEEKIARNEKKAKEKKKLNFQESLKTIANSKYLLCIATIVVSYNLVIHMVEVIWKDNLHTLYPTPAEYNLYTNNLTSIMAAISVTSALFMSGIMKKFGWTKTALITPAILLITTGAFFSCVLLDKTLTPLLSGILGTTPLALAVFLGSFQNCFTKAAKYSLFDTTKEMAFIPLSSEEKLKSKAAIDGIGSRLGKSGGSLVHQGLLMIFLTVSNSTPFVAALLLGVIALWMLSVKTLGHLLEKKMETNASYT